MVTVEPAEYRKYEGADISGQKHVIEIRKTGKPVLSAVFTAVENVNAIAFHYPVFSEKKEFIGSVSMLIREDALLGRILLPLVKGKPCKIWMMQPDGLVVYDPDPGQIGRNIFTDELYRPFKDLISVSKTVAAAQNGAGSYDFYAKGLQDKTIVKKYVVWDTFAMRGSSWRIVVMEVE